VSGPLIYVVAGEPSGDRLGAALIRALATLEPELRFAGLGGARMRGAGLAPLFDIRDLNVMGLAEVVPRLPTILGRIRQTTRDVLDRAPAALVTIDSPAFGLRVAERVRARNPAIRTIHYVAPSVWAWRPGRARHMAQFVDHVLGLLPFDPPYMRAAGMTCDFVGHPVVEAPPLPEGARLEFRDRAGLTPDQPVLLMAPGSRAGEIRRHLPVFEPVVGTLAARHPNLAILMPLTEPVAEPIRAATRSWTPAPMFLAPDAPEAERRAGFAAADAALVKSGTIVLETAAAGTPMVAVYRTSWLTATIVRRIARVDTANLVSLLAGRRAVPEFLQEHCRIPEIVRPLDAYLADPSAGAAQRTAFAEVMTALGAGGEAPSLRAARSLLRAIG